MKKQKVFTISFMFILFINVFFVMLMVLPLHSKNHFISKEIPEKGDTNFIINSNTDNVLEFYANFKPHFAPLRIVTFIGQNDIRYDKDFAYLAAIPMGLYNENRVLKVSPILYDDLNFAQEYFLNDWKDYCKKFDSWDGIKNIVYIGNVSAETKNSVEDLLNPEMLRNTEIPAIIRQPVNIVGNDTYDLAAQIATYFWYKPDTVVIAAINETFPTPRTTYLNFSDTLNINGLETRSGELSTTHLEDFWWDINVTGDSGGIFVKINNTDDLAMDLIGNFSQPTSWIYDTNKISRTNWVFFPNVSYPANMSDWGLRVYNITPILTPIPYNLNFTILTYQTYQITINNSESRLDISLNWTNSTDDLNFWVLDPSYQLVGASSRWGNLYETGNVNKSSSILYPAKGTWTILLTHPNGNNAIPYNLTVNITEFSSYRRQCIESAANGAIIASLLNKPLLYVTNATVPETTKQALSILAPNKTIFVDPFKLMSEDVFNNISALDVNLTQSTNLTSRTELYDFIYSITNQPDLVLSSVNEGYFAPASLLAAFHGAPLLFTLNESYNIHAGALKNFAIDSWIGFQNPGDSALLNQSIPRFQDMKGLADIFYDWLDSINLDKGGNETVLIVSPITELNPFFDRAIYGKALVGRFATLDARDVPTFICRNILYPALSYSNLSYGFESQIKAVSCGGNSTITGMQLDATNFSGDYTACQYNDEIYHTYYNNSNGQIFMAYYVNLSESQILYDNISQIEILLEGKIGYSNDSIQVAGWGIWNWTEESYVPINNTVLNATTDQFDRILINSLNLTSLISPNNSRIEIFINVTTTGPPVNASIDFIQFNVTYDHIQNNPLMLSSSITYWHNFTFQGKRYNFSSLIPLNFTQYGYQVENLTGYQEIYSQLTDNCKFWYYSGNSTLNESEYQNGLDTLFTEINYWRAFGDYDDFGASPQNPDADGDHLVTANETLGKWQSMSEFNASLSQLHSTFVLLQTGYLGYSLIPKYLMEHGATTILANLKQNELGYSEYFSYNLINEILLHKNIGDAMIKAFNHTSHIYSQNWEGDIVGTDSFSNFTEDLQQFILYGDPELMFINTTYELPLPTSYRPLIHEFSNITVRKYDAPIAVNITDLDSNLMTEVITIFNINGTEVQINNFAAYDPSYDLFLEQINFYNTSEGDWEPLGVKIVNWRIYDVDNEIQLSVPIHLLTNPPYVVTFITRINKSGSYNDITHPDNDTMGRLNESLYVSFRIGDIDQDDTIPENTEFNVTLILKNINDNSTLNFQMENQFDGDPWDIGSNWSYEYQFGVFNTTGQYQILIWINDSNDGILSPSTVYEYFHLTNWVPEANGTDFVITNGTGPEHQVYRINETLEVFASIFDVDGNQTHVQNVTSCFYKDPGQWINISMNDPESDNNWTGSYKFTEFNKSGIWNISIKVTDKDNLTVRLYPNFNITVMNHPPDQPFNLTMRDFNLTDITSILRNNTVQFFGNATDFDVFNRTATLSLFSALKDPTGIVRYEEVMTYSNVSKLWGYNFTPQITDPIGNWTFYVSVVDEANTRTNSSEVLTLTILNNIPVIQTVNIEPIGGELYIGEPLSISGTVFDVEKLANISVFIEDENGKSINITEVLQNQSDTFLITFEEANYTSLESTGTWNITIRLYDADGNFTSEFTFGLENNSVTIIVRPRQEDGEEPFPYEIIIIIAIVVTTVLATYLVYRTRKKEATVIPAARVKQIIKKISKEKDDKIAETRADIKARIKVTEIKPKPRIEILPSKIEDISEEEKELMNKEMQGLVKKAQVSLKNNLFEAAAIAYHDAAKLASKLKKDEIAKVYLTRGEEILEKKSELKKKAKKVAKEQKEMTRKPKEKLSRAEAENIKAEIGEIMRSARKAIREEDYISASKQYREVSELYRKINDEEKAEYFEEKAEELL
ncbi:MAG: hypothetical protein HWN66_03290 [Candidatus Helarchaeota archaeon]|nr:hypothetical protein [Candidatus Helarchaeota archaeon]